MAALEDFVREANRFLVDAAPWAVAKDESRRQELADSIYEALETLRLVALFAAPAMPRTAEALWGHLGIPEPLERQRVPAAAAWGLLEPGTPTTRGGSLFPRIEADSE
jgi:methionyl-tRNA synthetase